MIANRHVRYLLGLILGGCAGLSLTVSVLPLVLQMASVGDDLVLARVLTPFWPWVALLWGAGGWLAARAGTPLRGAASLGAAGGVAGGLLAILGLPAGPGPVAVAVIAGGIYGGLGGLILGRLLAEPGAEAA